MKKIISFVMDEEGATAVEYGIMVALIAVVTIVLVALVGRRSCNVYSEVASALDGV